MLRQPLLDSRGNDKTRWRGVLVVIGGVLVHLSLGTLYTFGNLSPYITSYMRWHGSATDLDYTTTSWIFALAITCQGLFMGLGGVIESRLGPRWTCLLGSWIMSLGVGLTSLSVKHSFPLAIITYGMTFGTGLGIAYAVPLSCSMRWFPEKKGLVNGLVVAGFGGGAFIFNFVQTAYINPNNLPTEMNIEGESYFDQPEVLDKVPYVFVILASCYAAMQFIGSMCLCNPPGDDAESPEEEYEDTIIEEEEIVLHGGTNKDDGEKLFQGQININQEVEDVSLKPSQMLRSKHFYMLWSIFLLNGQGSVFISSLYKAYGQTFIKDDTFMAVVGAFAAVFNGLGRISWGAFADRTSFRLSMLLAVTLFTCMMLTFQLTSLLGRGTFFLWVCLLFGAFSASFSLMPTAIAKRFGRKYMTINYGILFTSQVVTAPLGVMLTSNLMDAIGWSGLFFLVSSCTFASMLVTISFDAKDRFGREI